MGAALVVAVLAFGWAGTAGAATRSEKCEAAKLKASGIKTACLLKAEAKAVKKGRPRNISKCESRFEAAFAKAEKRYDPDCPTVEDADAVEERLDTCAADVAAALSGSPLSDCQQFPATGQTTCWNRAGDSIDCAGTGQDGDIRAGAALSYTDNDDGTITDNNTGLMWEKLSDDGGIHDKDNTYTWDNAFAQHIAGLNSEPCFAGHCDWRLPNIKELQSIVNYQNVSPSVSPAFNTNCVGNVTVLDGSCTRASFYWSSTSYASFPADAWDVNFEFGFVVNDGKGVGEFVRAVRGGR